MVCCWPRRLWVWRIFVARYMMRLVGRRSTRVRVIRVGAGNILTRMIRSSVCSSGRRVVMSARRASVVLAEKGLGQRLFATGASQSA